MSVFAWVKKLSSVNSILMFIKTVKTKLTTLTAYFLGILHCKAKMRSHLSFGKKNYLFSTTFVDPLTVFFMRKLLFSVVFTAHHSFILYDSVSLILILQVEYGVVDSGRGKWGFLLMGFLL